MPDTTGDEVLHAALSRLQAKFDQYDIERARAWETLRAVEGDTEQGSVETWPATAALTSRSPC